jgi:hypothetical protein
VKGFSVCAECVGSAKQLYANDSVHKSPDLLNLIKPEA